MPLTKALLLSAAAAAAAAADPTETILRRARHCASLKAFAAELVLQPQQAPPPAHRPRRELGEPPASSPELWPGIIKDSSRWHDKRPSERNALRQRERARQGVGMRLLPPGRIRVHASDACADSDSPLT